MTIGFVHPHKAFLPELIAYVEFFSGHGITTRVITKAELSGSDCDVEWHFMGQQTWRNKDRITIHEYASASVPPFSTLKDRIKQLINATPDYRIFNNEYVLKQFQPNDGIPYGIRNYGIPSGTAFLEPAAAKKYDFVYVGTLEKSRQPEVLLDSFATGALKDHSLLVLTRNYDELGNAYTQASNITFKGPIPYNEVYAHIQQARFGINYIPDILPYNQQTSAKFIDYAACRLQVVTTDYAWVRNFQNHFGGNCFYLKGDLSNFTWENVNRFSYALPDLSSWTWEKQIRTSGVLQFLETKIKELKF
jgi:glycosyltransferase involved in cell wall biosynthesis